MLRPLIRCAALVALSTPLACKGPTLAEGVSLAQYVETMAALRRIQDDPTRPPYAKKESRDSVLAAHGVTAKQLEGAAAVLANDPQRAYATWQAIERRVAEVDTTKTPR